MKLVEQIGRRLTLRDLNVFMTVFEVGNMARAADRLAVSQPVVSKTIADLEIELGVPLFDRRRHGVEPTVYGRTLAARGAAVFDEIRLAAKEIESLADPNAGEVRIAGAEMVVAGLLAHAVEQVRRSHPRMTIHVSSTLDGSRLQEPLHRREVDFTVGRLSLLPTDASLVAEELYQERLFVVAGRDAQLPVADPLHLRDLLDAAWVLPLVGGQAGPLVRDAFRIMGLEPPRDVLTTSSLAMICALVATGHYLAMIPASILRFSILRHAIRVVLTLPEVPPGPVGIVTLAGRSLTPAAELFIAHLRRLAVEMGDAHPDGNSLDAP